MVAADPGGVLVVGGGLCAAVVAHRLDRAGVPFRLLCPDDTPAIHRVPLQAASGHVRHRGLALGWADGLGGTTNLWGGQLWPWEPDDHGPGWPDWVRSLDRHYRSVARLLDPSRGCAELHAAATRGASDAARLWPELASRFEVRASSWLPRRHRSVRPSLRRSLRRSGALLSGWAREVACDEGGAVVSVDASDGGHELRASTVVIAAGTLGTVALLARSRQADGAWPALGRGMVDHTSFHVGTLRAPDRPRLLTQLTDRFDGGRRRSPKLVFRDDATGRRAYVHVRPARPVRAPGLASSGEAARAVLEAVGSRRFPAPFGLEVRVDVEQLVVDGHRVDVSGDPPRLVWDVVDAERTMAAAIGRDVLQAFAAVIPGRTSTEWHGTSHVSDIYHLMGGARIGDRPDDGVVTSELRLHGMPRVAVAGLSVFPEAGVANPSFLAAAMADRLATQIVEERT